MNKTISVIGLGYVGLPTALVFAKAGFEVKGVDANKQVVDSLNAGKCHINEPGLQELLENALASKCFAASTSFVPADVFIMCLPTYLSAEKTADLTPVEKASDEIRKLLKKGDLVILESTVPPGTCESVVKPRLEKSGLRVGADVMLAHCPERIFPGKALHEIVHNERLIGGFDEASGQAARELYSSFVKSIIHLTDCRTSETVKLMENIFRDVNIALANEFALICARNGVNVWEAIELANLHPRVNIHKPGPGVGGYCIPIVPYFLAQTAPENAEMIKLARRINDEASEMVAEKVEEILGNGTNKKIAVLGVAYKGDVDDARHTPALAVINSLEKKGFEVRAFDPIVKKFAKPLHSLEDSVRGADCVLALTDHSAFKKIDANKIAGLVGKKLVIDARNCIDSKAWQRAGFQTILLWGRK